MTEKKFNTTNHANEIELEPFINEHGFLILRDRESKREIAWQSGVKVDLSNIASNEYQEATISVVVDQRVSRDRDD